MILGRNTSTSNELGARFFVCIESMSKTWLLNPLIPVNRRQSLSVVICTVGKLDKTRHGKLHTEMVAPLTNIGHI